MTTTTAEWAANRASNPGNGAALEAEFGKLFNMSRRRWTHRRLNRACRQLAWSAAGAAGVLVALGVTLWHDPPARASRIIDDTESGTSPVTSVTSAIDFNRDIRPILSDTCFRCHGPDHAAREANLRLDLPDAATALRDENRAAIVPGHPEQSVLIERITAPDPADRMPPADSGKALTVDQIEVLRRWIAEGAQYDPHWSFVAPTRPSPPDVSNPGWVRNPIDAFVLHQLDERNLKPSPEAEKARLLRRASLDLTGLPPTIDELDAFLADDSSDAYERAVDRMLDSPAYGEHMARYWLDAARYGDTHGLHLDNYREMWRWRDWVINAFNSNMPFDEFTIEQLAGDLLPDPTTDQLIATGFNRNNVTTSEGGAIDAEYLVKYAMDRVETTSTVWMGLTAGCAECHDHKFDPITQEEFYQLFAFFNNVAENAMDGNQKAPPPVVLAPTAEQKRELENISARIEAIESTINAPNPEIDQAQREWETRMRERVASWWTPFVPEKLTSTAGSTLTPLDDGSVLATGANPAKDDYIVVGSTDLTDIRLVRLDALTHESLPHNGPGRAENANFVLSEIELVAVSTVDPSVSSRVRFARGLADFSQEQGGFLADRTIDGVVDDDLGWAVAGYERRENRSAVLIADEPFGFEGGTELRFMLRHQSKYAQHGIGRFRLSLCDSSDLYDRLAAVTSGDWYVVGPFDAPEETQDAARTATFEPEKKLIDVDLSATYGDAPLAWVKNSAYSDGELHNVSDAEFAATYLHRTFTSPAQREVVFSIGSDDGFVLWVNGAKVAKSFTARSAALDQDRIEVELKPGANDVVLKVINYAGGYAFSFRVIEDDAWSDDVRALQLLAIAPADRSEDQQNEIRTLFRRQHSPEMRELYDKLAGVRAEEVAFRKTIPTTLIMRERDERRMAHVLRRGQYDDPQQVVQPGVPACLPPLPDDAPADRLALARWLVNGDHPLTSRVTVNRLWQQVFGRGIVRTSEDFGSQGAPPAHPDLLDWLAVEFEESGWDVKHVMRLFVTSSAYRQTSRISRDRLAADPSNEWYARGPRFRMDAEMIRDLALSASGLLVAKIGGPSVKPYQPAGIWQAVAYPDSDTRMFTKDEGEAQYRRSIYTFWKRTQPPPNLATFDAPTRETCTVRRPRTNTPMQMLVLMNDPQFVEAAVALADRVLQEKESHRDRITLAFRLVLSREPDEDELATLRALLGSSIDRYVADPDAAAALVDVGDFTPSESIDPVQLAAWTTVTSTILSLDEAMTKG